MIKLFVLYIILILFCFHISDAFSQCGKERWNVKTLTDNDTTYIDFTNVISSKVSEQVSIKRPKKIKNMPRLKSECNVYEIEAYIIEYKKEDDRDFHVVIQDPETEETMVVEILDPECPDIDKTSRYDTFKQVREWFIKEFKPTNKFKKTFRKVKLTGVGFFDYIHGQKGMAKNGRELHPVLKIEFVK